MKLRRIIAAVLCGVMLTGCQADERPQSSASESVSATVPETTTTTAATPPIPYDHESYIIWLSPKCGRSDCPGRKQAISGNRLECYAIQIS